MTKKSNNLFRLSLIFTTIIFLLLSKNVVALNEPTIISVFGDSISLGYNQTWINTYCGGDPACLNNRNGNGALNLGSPSTLLKENMDDSNRPTDVINLGVGGSASGASLKPSVTSNNGVGRITNDLKFVNSNYGNNKDSFVLIIYGTNDHGYDIGPSTTGFNIEQMIIKSIAENTIPIVGTIPPCSCKNVVPVNDKIITAANKSYAKPVYFVDHYQNLVNEGWGGLVEPDGIHPNDQGYSFIADSWFNEQIKALVKSNTIIAPIISILLSD